jgi:hypothetical protein
VRAQRSLWYAFNLSGRVQQIPVPEEATSSWRLRLGTDAEGYGGTGLLVHSIPAVAPENAVNDAPKRLLELPPPPRLLRTVTVQAWSAVVYVARVPGEDESVQ